jgi:predicted nucleic acid-binding protein
MVFVDTSAWFAYFLPVDPKHQPVRRCFASLTEPIATTDYCIDETLTLLSVRGEIQRALAAGRAFFHQDIAKVQFLAADQIQRAWILFQRRAASGWSFTDCTSKIVIDDLAIKTAVALDQHFRQFAVVP